MDPATLAFLIIGVIEFAASTTIGVVQYNSSKSDSDKMYRETREMSDQARQREEAIIRQQEEAAEEQYERSWDRQYAEQMKSERIQRQMMYGGEYRTMRTMAKAKKGLANGKHEEGSGIRA